VTPSPEKRSPLLIALPSSVTLLGVLGGFLCLIWAPTQPYWAACAIIGASLCDMIDGRIARLTNTSSAFGVQLDSLADLASSGIPPAFLIYHWGLAPIAPTSFDPTILAVFVFVAACAIRLARFNLGQSDTKAGVVDDPGFFIIGLPTPVAALFLTTLTMTEREVGLTWLRDPVLLIGFALLLSALMVSRIPFPSYKRFKSRARQLAFFAAIVSGLTLLIAGGPGGTVLFVLMVAYVVVGSALALIKGPRLTPL
jgi:CDP-diacylglycerol---serine O-phosphatidyltransferase